MEPLRSCRHPPLLDPEFGELPSTRWPACGCAEEITSLKNSCRSTECPPSIYGRTRWKALGACASPGRPSPPLFPERARRSERSRMGRTGRPRASHMAVSPSGKAPSPRPREGKSRIGASPADPLGEETRASRRGNGRRSFACGQFDDLISIRCCALSSSAPQRCALCPPDEEGFTSKLISLLTLSPNLTDPR